MDRGSGRFAGLRNVRGKVAKRLLGFMVGEELWESDGDGGMVVKVVEGCWWRQLGEGMYCGR